MNNLPWSKIIKLSREEWPYLGWGFLFLIISSGCLLVYPQSIKLIIDEALKNKDQNALNFALKLALVIFIVQAITGALRYYYFTLAGEKTVKRLRQKLFSQVISQNMEFFDRAKTGELLGRLSADTAVLQNALSVNISMLFRNLAQAIGGVILLFSTSPKLTFFILALIPPLGFLAGRFGKKVKGMSRKTQDALAGSSAVAEESLSGVRTVKAFAQEQYEINRYGERLEFSFKLSVEKIKEIAKFTSLVMGLGLTSVVFIIWYGGTLVINGEMSVGTLTSYLLYVMTVAFSVGMLGSLYTDFMSAFGASGRIFELLEKLPEVTHTEKKLEQVSALEGKIEFKNVAFSYPTRPDVKVLEDVSFTINPRETLAIVGSSGGGKSTIVQLLLRFYNLSSGDILIDGKSLQTFDLESLRGSIGLVSQEPVLISETLEENIRYGKPGSSLLEVEQAAQLAHVTEFIGRFPEGYKTLVGEKGVQLSGGQKQRVAIARAIIKNPPILILDEATSALDAESEHLVRAALENQVGKRTTIVIAHRLSTVKKADRIIVLHQGKMVESGTHDQLMKSETAYYKKLVERQFE
ncbi:MAG: ABC transporter ATP-binding protein [Bacteriovoracaceae bacterium]